jgi:hypothetical protein
MAYVGVFLVLLGSATSTLSEQTRPVAPGVTLGLERLKGLSTTPGNWQRGNVEGGFKLFDKFRLPLAVSVHPRAARTLGHRRRRTGEILRRAVRPAIQTIEHPFRSQSGPSAATRHPASQSRAPRCGALFSRHRPPPVLISISRWSTFSIRFISPSMFPETGCGES